MKIRSFLHKDLRRLYVEGNAKGLPPDAVAKLSAMLTFLQDMRNPAELTVFPLWRVHRLHGARKDTWSLHVTRNWRLTFRFEEGEVVDVDFEDYH